MTTQQQIKDLQKTYAPLTEAEALWVANNDELSEEDAVEAVKAMRTGPYRDLESVVTVDDDSDEEAAEPDPFPWDDEKVLNATAADLADYVKEHPEEATRVASIEDQHPGGPRKTVLEAIASVVEVPGDDGGEG